MSSSPPREKAGFEVLITVDQNLRHQENFRNRALAIIALRSRTTNIDDSSDETSHLWPIQLAFQPRHLNQDGERSFRSLDRTIKRVAFDGFASGFPDEPQKLAAS